ncbi:MAG: membrane integrity-associated transporter subunit PqiC [Marinobacter sp.]|nr:membrane integrity-associated transporter subunit PqiC [Marinobacter sp.]
MDLAPSADQAKLNPAKQVSLRIDTPLASHPLDSSRILLKPSPYEFQAVPGVRWRDSMPVVLRDHLIQSYRKSGAFKKIVTDTSPATTTHTLISELTAFHAENRSDGAFVVIDLHTEVMNNRSRHTLCADSHRLELKAESAVIEDLVVTFSEGAQALSASTNRWVFDCLGDDKRL